MTDPRARALIAHAHAAATAADHARALVLTTTTPMSARHRIHAARRLRILDLAVLDLAVIAARTERAPWALIATALALPEHETVRRYQPTIDVWDAHDLDPAPTAPALPRGAWPGSLVDDDLPATAAMLDAWAACYADAPPGVVSGVLR